MLIYKATNLINGKVYIGQTTKTLEERMKRHKQDSKKYDTYFYRAINKYGWNNFIWEIIHDNINDEDELDRLEEYYISLYQSFDNKEKGYNTQSGGKHFKITKEERQKRRLRALGIKNPMFGKPGTWKGKSFSLEHKKKISESLKGKAKPYFKGENNPSAKRIINISTGEVFGCIKDAANKYNISTNALFNNLSKKTKSCCGCVWEYYDENTHKNLKPTNIKVRNPKKQVYVKELDQVFKTATAAAKAIGCDNSLVSKICKHTGTNGYGVAKGYHIKYVEEE